MPFSTVFPLRVPGIASLLGALLVVLGLTPVADLVHALASRLIESEIGVQAPVMLERALAGAGPVHLVTVVLGFALVPALVEESLFRGLVTAAHRHSFWGALFAPAVLFGLIHLEPAQAAGTMVLGLAFGLARLFSGSLLTAIFAHAAYNTVVIVTTHMSHDSLTQAPSTVSVVVGLLVAIVGVVLLPMGRVTEPRDESARGAPTDAD
jgi:membrane protease YdiL (CAAX protease family)